MTEPTCWADEVQLQRAQRMYLRGLLWRLPGTLAEEARRREQCRADVAQVERDNEGDN